MSVFAEPVRTDNTSKNRDGILHTENAVYATVPYVALENAELFHAIAEQLRVEMIEAIRASGAPINVWRVGQFGGVFAVPFDVRTGETGELKDSHVISFRTRTSCETAAAQERASA